MQIKRYKSSVIRRVSSEVVKHSMLTVVSNTVLCTCSLLAINLEFSIKKKKVNCVTRWMYSLS